MKLRQPNRIEALFTSYPQITGVVAGTVLVAIGFAFLRSKGLWITTNVGAGLILFAAAMSAAPLLKRLFASNGDAVEREEGQNAGRRWLSAVWEVFAFFLFVGGYVTVVGWFATVNVYEDHFFGSDYWFVPIGYNIARVAFMVYLAWIFYYLGSLVERAMRPLGATWDFGLLDGFVLRFFTGGALLHLVMFAMGFLNLYYRELMMAVSIPLIAVSYLELRRFGRKAGDSLIAATEVRHSVHERTGFFVGVWLIVMALTLLLLAKGIFPGVDGDYASHYFPYYRAVIENHGIHPNDVWYHYYFTKGAGGTFFCMLLTDLLGSQLLSFVYVAGSVLALIALVWRATKSRLWAIAGAAVYIAGMIYTPGSGLFEKQHVVMGGMFAGLVWLWVQVGSQQGGQRIGWAIFATMQSAAVIIFAPTSAALVCGMAGIMAAVALVRRRFADAGWNSLLASASVGIILIVMAINYVQTGLAEITPFRVFWKFADQEKLSTWVSPYMMVLLEEGSSNSMGAVSFNATRLGSVEYWEAAYRIPSLRFLGVTTIDWLVLILVAAAGVYLAMGRRRFPDLPRAVGPPIALLAASFLLAQFMNQPVSMLRYFFFTAFLTTTLWTMAVSLFVQCAIRMRFYELTACVLTSFIALGAPYIAFRNMPATEIEHRLEFAMGERPLSECFRPQHGLWEPAINAHKFCREDSRIWSLHPHLMCMAPNGATETIISYRLDKNWHETAFTSLEESKRSLRESGLDYFLFDLNQAPFDILPYTPAFRPENIRDHLGVVWSENGAYLLTWKSDQTSPLPPGFEQQYREFLSRPIVGVDWQGLYDRLRDLYRDKQTHYPIARNPNLPPLKGWQ